MDKMDWVDQEADLRWKLELEKLRREMEQSDIQLKHKIETAKLDGLEQHYLSQSGIKVRKPSPLETAYHDYYECVTALVTLDLRHYAGNGKYWVNNNGEISIIKTNQFTVMAPTWEEVILKIMDNEILKIKFI